ncbi:MAG: 16S rRNA (guanine(966)-N(2))-methyltransferase RsmD [Rhodospirillales bacterium]|nr:16S rRNA (guanine(966)-N(2))-methyltransferase RsmD [Rhodospirillales bacterium]
MRIVAGKHKGRVLQAPKGRNTRPTSDRTRGAVFNILEHGIEDFDLRGSEVLDVFAGTGALGLEALSRGAAKVTFMEIGREALKYLNNNIVALKVEEQTQVLKSDATRPRASSTSYSLIFLDPPYGKGFIPKALSILTNQGWVTPGGLCVAEEGSDQEVEIPEHFELLDRRDYGSAQILFLKYKGSSPEIGLVG